MNPPVETAQAAPKSIVNSSLPELSKNKASLRFLLSHPAHFIALGMGSGLSKFAPGTAGTLWVWVAYAAWAQHLSAVQMGLLIFAAALLGTWACSVAAEHLNLPDPSCIVWDEMVAFAAVLCLLAPSSFLQQLAAFALFRFFDAVKPGPVAWADELFHGEKGWKNGFGIMLDDFVAAFCTLLIVALWRF